MQWFHSRHPLILSVQHQDIFLPRHVRTRHFASSGHVGLANEQEEVEVLFISWNGTILTGREDRDNAKQNEGYSLSQRGLEH
jgi:hypothetical protein